MKKNASLLLFVLAVSCFFAFPGFGAGDPAPGKPLPEIILNTPEDSAHIAYLGLPWDPGTPFRLSEIDADILVIELFSMYCPYCQNAAPNVNALYELMEKIRRPDLNMVIIGIGANNNELEVETFRRNYTIKFPLFPDKDMTIYRALEGKGTPTFIASKKGGDEKIIFLKKAGGFADPSEFLESLLNRSGLK